MENKYGYETLYCPACEKNTPHEGGICMDCIKAEAREEKEKLYNDIEDRR